jgi:hypothetical protein
LDDARCGSGTNSWGNVTETGFERVARQGRLPAWISSPTADIVSRRRSQHASWLYLRFTLSYRDVEELLTERGLEISYETVRRWVLAEGRSRQLRGGSPDDPQQFSELRPTGSGIGGIMPVP